MHSCHANLFRQVESSRSERLPLGGQAPEAQSKSARAAAVRAGGRLPGKWPSMQGWEQHVGNCCTQVFLDFPFFRWLLLRAALRCCVSWRLAALSKEILQSVIRELGSLTMTAEESAELSHCTVELQAKHACRFFARLLLSPAGCPCCASAGKRPQAAEGSRPSALYVPSKRQERTFLRPAGVLCSASTGAAGATRWNGHD